MTTGTIACCAPAAAVLILAGSVEAAAVPVWRPTDGDINLITVTASVAGYDFAIFDSDDIGSENSGASALPLADNYDTISVSRSLGGDWLLTNAGGSLNLGASSAFVFASSVDNGVTWDLNTGFTADLPEKIYTVAFTGGPGDATFTAVDVRPVPVPAPLALLGSGLLGLAAVGRRRL